jgi:4-hydroxybenzoate polyprenyltransferase
MVELADAMRIRQWPKNLLVFLPLLASHRVLDTELLGATCIAFLALCLTASTVYLLNDFFDIHSDRRHPSKRHRPFASGALPIGWGLAAIALLGPAAFALAATLAWTFTAVLMLYVLLTLAYTILLKRFAMLDVILLAVFYGIRVVLGYEATDLAYSVWLLAFTQFLFVSLAFMKRDIELSDLTPENEEVLGRGYRASDRSIVGIMGVTSGLMSILVFSLYIDSDVIATQYEAPWLLWLACPVLAYGIGRMWLLARRGMVDDDPLMFLLGDRISYLLGMIILAIALSAKFGVTAGNL